nr:hypothetical protein [Roseovarius sp.]
VLRADAGPSLSQTVAVTDTPEKKAPVPEPEPQPEVEQTAPAAKVDEGEVSKDIPQEMAEPAAVEMPEGLEDETGSEPEAVGEVQAVAEPEPVEEEKPAQAEVEAEEVAQDPEPVQEPLDSESIAAKLSRIRSVVSGDDQSFGADEYNEDEHAQDFIDTTAADLNAALAEDEDAGAEASEAGFSMVEIDDDELAAIMTRANSEVIVEDEAEDAPEEPGTAQAVDEDERQDDVAAEAPKTPDTGSEFEDTLASLLADAIPAETTETEVEAEDISEIEEPAAPEAEPSVAATAEREPALTHARVIKIKRTEFEAAVASGLFQEDDDDDASEASDRNLFEEGESFLSPEEEAELQRELAEFEAEFENALGEDFAESEDEADDFEEAVQADAAEAEAEAEVNAEAEVEAEARDDAEFEEETAVDPEPDESHAQERQQGRRRLENVEKPSDLTRIFDETDNQLDAPASSQRRNAIQHLRAAVAATRAETDAGAKPGRGTDDSAYRDDLASVVRPRRPQVVSDAGRSARPEEARPAPLKLVAEQRIDTPREPIRPRRVSTSDIAPIVASDDGDGGFSAFAEEMGASQLPELLEAAAAYLADVEGRPQFSRPMLMGKLKEVEQESFSREDGLRSFGQLLRQGKLQKLAGGRFSVTKETDYRDPGARNVG